MTTRLPGINLFAAVSFVVFGGGCFCFEEGSPHFGDCGNKEVVNSTDECVIGFTVLPGDARNPNSNLAKAQRGDPISSFDPETSQVYDPHSTGRNHAVDMPGAQGAVVACDDLGNAIPSTLAGTQGANGDQAKEIVDFDTEDGTNPLFIQELGGGEG